eukprot:TRINITY_DN5391_c0_g2_i1.p2 TRINITY_DN5391_c0_g2~~TRINITY_DN5391_c0_g2_i1.p2  ORF type:complete len:276 (-),score=35.73 TRINITY_DN5391_c0_g2_i1:322-1149(-)
MLRKNSFSQSNFGTPDIATTKISMSSDPYPQVKEIVIGDLDRVERLKLSAEAKQPGANSALASAAKDLDQDVKQLEGVVAACQKNPYKFGLDYDKANYRQHEVSQMRARLNVIKNFISQQKAAGQITPTPSAGGLTQASVEMVSNQEQDRMRLLGAAKAQNQNSQSSPAGNPTFDNQFQEQQMIMQQQDTQLDGMTRQVDNVKQVAIGIGDELKDQHKMLEELDQDVETTSTRLQAAILRIDTVIRKSGIMCQMLTIVSLIVILILLICWVFGVF